MIFFFARKSGHIPDWGGKHFSVPNSKIDRHGGSSDSIWAVLFGKAFENQRGISNLNISDFCLSLPHLRK